MMMPKVAKVLADCMASKPTAYRGGKGNRRVSPFCFALDNMQCAMMIMSVETTKPGAQKIHSCRHLSWSQKNAGVASGRRVVHEAVYKGGRGALRLP